MSFIRSNYASLLKILASLLLWQLSTLAWAEISADKIFSERQDSVFQIRIIEKKSGSQAALGTGFFIADNLVATNYHVVSNEVLEPAKYRVEVERDDVDYEFKVITVDVVADLAILKPLSEDFSGEPFELAPEAPKKGEVLYSLGNPHDLGMTVVQGNYNGLVDNKFWDRIHFSGAINSGMSGGPTVNQGSKVVGINVASSGNQIGFLVPVEKLAALIEKSRNLSPEYELLSDMALQIRSTTDAMVDDVLAAEWTIEDMDKAKILGKTVPWFECWGNSEEDEDRGILEIAKGCNNADNIFISSSANTGFFEYEFAYFEAKNWPSSAFYRYLARHTSSAYPGNRMTEEFVGNYECTNDIVQTHEKEGAIERRISYCVRPYKTLPGLYDVFYMGVSQDKSNYGVMDHFTLAGVSQQASMKFLRKFVEVLQWQ